MFLKDAMKFWLNEKMVDGLRIDAVKHLYENEDLEDEIIISSNLNRPVS